MSLVIPSGYANFHITFQNTAGGLSSRSSVAYGALLNAPLTQADVGRIANILRDGHTPLVDNGWLLGPTHVNETQGGVAKVWDDTGTEAGVASAALYPGPATALLVSKVTGLAGRQHRGRVYLPGLREDAYDEGGVLNGADVNSRQVIMDAFRTAFVADAAINFMVVFHDSSTPGLLAPNEVLNLLVRNVVGTMRPRQRR